MILIPPCGLLFPHRIAKLSDKVYKRWGRAGGGGLAATVDGVGGDEASLVTSLTNFDGRTTLE